MDEKRKRVTAPRIAAALSALLAGAALYTVSGSERQGIQVKEYTEAAEAADSTIMVYMNGSDLEGVTTTQIQPFYLREPIREFFFQMLKRTFQFVRRRLTVAVAMKPFNTLRQGFSQ